MLAIVSLLLAAIAPTPAQYYADALAKMNALPQPGYVTFNMNMRASGAGIKAQCDANSAAFAIGWGSGMTHSLEAAGAYRASDGAASFLEKGRYCRDDVAFFKPGWGAVHDWIRYGIFEPPRAATMPSPVPAPHGLSTIVSVTSLAPSAYVVQDMGAERCPAGADGHALHFIARENPDKHPLMDAIVETSTLRLCMVRLRLLASTLAGTGARGDVELDMGQSGAFWMVAHTHAVLSMRLLGANLKSLIFDMDYGSMAYPATLPETDFPSRS